MKRTHRMAVFSAPNLSLEDWQRLLKACPFPRKGDIATGDFLACVHVSQTQLSIARAYGGCTINGKTFLYLPQHDMLVRTDFHGWAMENWNAVLAGADSKAGNASTGAQGKGG